jgi:hypothetical protein
MNKLNTLSKQGTYLFLYTGKTAETWAHTYTCIGMKSRLVNYKVLGPEWKKIPRGVGIAGYRGNRKIPTGYRTNSKIKIWIQIPRQDNLQRNFVKIQKFQKKSKNSGFFGRYTGFPRGVGKSGSRPVTRNPAR